MIHSEHDVSRAGMLLEAFKSLADNAAWKEIAAQIAEAHKEHLDGSTARGRAAELRAEHVEAYHLAKTLDEYCQTRTAKLREDLREYQRKAASEMNAGPSEVLWP